MKAEQNEKHRWTELRPKLDQTYTYDDNWGKAITIFEDRLQKKFFKPIRLVIDGKMLEGEGFAIVTVQCALIEMFAAFKAGKIFNHARNAQSPKYEYNKSKQMFTNLLRTDEVFKDHFWCIDGNNKIKIDHPYSASDFYNEVRCGLMHEARTKKNWVINSAPKTVKVKTTTTFIATVNGDFQIYRTILHYRLLAYLTSYKEQLCQNDKNGKELRKNFARKLDDLFDFKPHASYNWWQ